MMGDERQDGDEYRNETPRKGWPLEVYNKMKEGHDRYMDSVESVTRPDSGPQDRVDPNPFVAFKDFIDTQFNALADSFRPLPDNFAELRRQMEREREQRQNERSSHFKRWTQLEQESPDHFDMRVDRASKAQRESAFEDALSAISASNRINSNASSEKIHALYRDESFPSNPFAFFPTPSLSPGEGFEYMEDGGNDGDKPVATTNASLWRWPPVEPNWLSVDWFKYSGYSPIQLENEDSGTKAVDTRWRRAFEDLIDASLGKPLVDATDRVNQRSSSTPGLQWLLSLHQRGTLPPLLPTIHRLSYNGSEAQRTINQLVADHANNGLPQSIPFAYHADMLELIDAHLAARLLGLPNVSKQEHTKHAEPEYARETSTSSIAPQTPEYQKLLARGKTLSGEDFSKHHLSFSELFDMIERMEQESQALDLDQRTSSDLLIPLINATPQPESRPDPRHDKVDVLSSLTTTHTTRLPDGTVTTKIVLKQRFVDGREETQEKVHTYMKPSSTRAENAGDSQDIEENRTSKAPVKSSWFWK